MGDNVVRITKVRRPAVRLAVAPARPSCFITAATCPRAPLAPPRRAGKSKFAKFQELELKGLSSSNWNLAHIPTGRSLRTPLGPQRTDQQMGARGSAKNRA
jgi:hypothetical protein